MSEWLGNDFELEMEFQDSVNIAKVTVITYWDKWAFANSVDPEQMPQMMMMMSSGLMTHQPMRVICVKKVN